MADLFKFMNPIAQHLSAELERRQEKNPNYSLRAFAKALGLDASSTSKILKGHRVPTLPTLRRIAKKIEMHPDDFLKLTSWLDETAKPKSVFAPFDRQHFDTRIEVLHLTILEALRIPSMAQSLETLCTSLKLEKSQFDRILGDLAGMGLIELDSESRKARVLKAHNTTAPFPVTSEKRKEIQKKFLGLAKEAVDEVPLGERDNSTLTIAVPSNRLAEFKTLVAQLRRKINSEAEKHIAEADTVYHFTFAVFPAAK